MEHQAQDRGGKARRPYEPPSIQSETIFETTALACGKLPGQQFTCMQRPSNS
jgi:hypothetical protein